MFLASSSVPLHCLARGFSSHVLRTCRLESDIRDSKEIVPIGEQEQQCAGPPDRKVWGPVPCSSTKSYTSRHDYRRTANMLMQGRCRKKAVWHAADGRRSLRKLRTTPNMEIVLLTGFLALHFHVSIRHLGVARYRRRHRSSRDAYWSLMLRCVSVAYRGTWLSLVRDLTCEMVRK